MLFPKCGSSVEAQISVHCCVCAGHKKEKGNTKEDGKSPPTSCSCRVGAVLPMSKWEMTASQAVSIRSTSGTRGGFILVNSNMLLF